MKKIALLADGWKRLITYAWVKGINTFNEKQSEPIEMLCACSDHCLLGIMLQISRQRIIRHTCSLWS